MAKWRLRSPTTNVTRVQFPLLALRVCCWFSPRSEKFFSGFLPSIKTNIAKLKFDPECTDPC